jgi:hypothetical protein
MKSQRSKIGADKPGFHPSLLESLKEVVFFRPSAYRHQSGAWE